MAMRTLTTLSILLVATTALASGAYAADSANKSLATQPAQQTANKDFGKLSVQGANAYRDIQLARLAIFNAEPADAKKEIKDAKTAIEKAQNDDAIFVEAESELRVPSKVTQNTKPVAWLPVEGEMVVDENYVASPQNSAALADANKSVKQGDRKGAMDKLKLAGTNVDLTVAVVPLAKTMADINQAADFISADKYYQANDVLMQAENGVRFDIADTSLVPAKSIVAKK
jgi:hypothetical protein